MAMLKRGGRGRLLQYIDILAPWVAIILFTIVMASVAPEKFLSQRNIISILISASSYIVVAVGMTFVMTGGGIDLSVGSVMGLSAAFIAVPVKHTPIDPILAVFLGLGAGTLLGLVNGLIITKLKIPDFIATLATMLAYRGFAQVWIGARILSRFPAAITYLGNARWGIVPVCVIVAVLVVVAGYFLYTRTKFGRYTIAIGGNRRAAIHAGIPVDRYKIYTYAFAGFMAALAAVIRLGNLDTYTAYLGEGYLLPTIAGVVIGGTALFGGIGRVWGSLAGALFITMLINGLVVLGLSYYWQQFTVGVLIVLAVAVYTVTGLRQSRGVGGGG